MELGYRYSSIIGRCNNPKNPNYKHYGGRGIKCLFTSCKHFREWVLVNLPHPTYRRITIDRINNDGHYEPGNLKLATQAEQQLNKRTTVWIDFRGQRILMFDFDSPYGQSWTSRLVARGLTGEEIIENAKAHAHKGAAKNWRQLRAWLDEHEYTTSSTQALATDLPSLAI